MKIIITGANGYLGSRLSLYLTKKGHKITAVCFPNIPQENNWANCIYQTIIGDIKDLKLIKQVSDLNVDAIIHLVSLNHYDSENEPNLVSQVNIMPTWNLLNSCASKGLKKFIYFSTIHVYGKNQNGFIEEKQKPTPFNAYGLTHFLSEEICNYYNRKTETNCINIRLSNSYGEPVFKDANCWDLVVNNLTKSAFLEKKIVLKSDGKAVRDFIHFSDICEGVNTLICNSEKDNKNTIHFSSSNSVSMIDIAILIRDIYLKRYKQNIPIYVNGDEPYNDVKSIDINTNIISNKLANSKGIEFKKQLNEGMENLFNYLETTLCPK